MSGVFGVVDPRRQIDIHILTKKMAETMSHRDWFMSDCFIDDAQHLSIGRIGIGIFNKASQPVWNATQNVALVMAGELYNRNSLKNDIPDEIKSDEQVALALYEKFGDDFITRLNGAFVIAILDRQRNQLLIVNDRFGLYPLYYAHHDGRLIFAPEMKGVLCDSGFRKELNLVALAEYMRFQHLLGDKTFFEELKLLPNATCLRYNIQTGRLALEPYWDFSKIPQLPHNFTFDEAVKEGGRLLKASVDKLTNGNHRLGVYLSAGVDSRVILGFIDRNKFPITTITYGQQNCRDVAYAQKIAAKVGTEQHYFEFPNGTWVADWADFHLDLTEGFHSWIHAHGMSTLDQVRSLIDVNLTGFGGGQSAIDWEDPILFQPPDDLAFSTRLFDLLSQDTTWPSLDEGEEKSLFSPDISSKMCGLAFDSFRSELAKYNYLPYSQQAAYFALCNPDRRLFQYFTVFHRSHIEQRFPFYDYPYFEFVYALPPQMLSERKLRRAIILDMMPHLANVPYDKDNLPITTSKLSRNTAKIIQRGKRFVNQYIPSVFPQYDTLYADYENYLRGELKDWGEALLFDPQTLDRGIFNPDFIKSVWARHQSGLEEWTIGKIAPIMTYEMMLRRFYD